MQHTSHVDGRARPAATSSVGHTPLQLNQYPPSGVPLRTLGRLRPRPLPPIRNTGPQRRRIPTTPGRQTVPQQRGTFRDEQFGASPRHKNTWINGYPEPAEFRQPTMYSSGSPETRRSTHSKSSAGLDASARSSCASSSAKTQPAARSMGTRPAKVGEASDSAAGIKRLSVIR